MFYRLIIVFILCILAVGVWAEDWTSLGNDAGRSRINTAEVLSDSFSPSWQYSISPTIVASPAISDGFVVFADRNGYIRALKESDGSDIWAFNTGSEIVASPAISAGRVYAPAADGKIYCLRLSDGVLIWDYASGGTEISSPNISNNVLFMGSGFPNHRVIALDILAAQPQLLWQAAVEQIVYSSPAISGIAIIIGCDSGRYYAFDKVLGAEIWNYNTGGGVLLSSPLVEGNSVYLLPGGANTKFYRIDMDSTLWPGANWDITLTDPNQPVGAILGTNLATSSLVKAGDYIGFIVRFDYSMDTNADTLADQYVLNEYAVTVNPATKTVKWQIATGSFNTANQNNIPPFGLCPSPAAFRTASGYLLAVASSLASQLRIVDTANGSVLRAYALDDSTQSSPAVSNSRIFVATKNGSVYALQNDVNHAPAPPIAGFSPANGVTIYTAATGTNVTISWNDASDTESTPSVLSYLIRIDDDGEVIENYDYSSLITAGNTSWVVTLLANQSGIEYTYSLRVIDPLVAYSEWSSPQSFLVQQDITPPDSPSNLRASSSNGCVDLYWNASESADAQGYLMAYQPAGGVFGTPLFIGDVTNYQVTGLTNGVVYTFRVWTEDYTDWLSTPVEISAAPNYMVFMNGLAYTTIADVLTVAQSGDVITLGANTFVLPATLYIKEGVSLKGLSPHQTILDASNIDTAIQLTGLNSGNKGNISDLMIYWAYTGIDAAGGYQVSVKNTVIKECAYGVYGNDTSTIDIVNNTLVSNTCMGIYVSGAAIIRNNIILNNPEGICWWGSQSDTAKLVISYNDVYGNNTDYVNCAAGTGDISAAVVFVDEFNNSYCEVVDSVTIDTGDPADDWSNEPEPNGGRINMGAYGNTISATTSSNIAGIIGGSETGSSGPKTKCFIATAAYGSPIAPTVCILRQFRDEYLLTNRPGNWFVSRYYHYSPPLADYISRHDWAKRLTQVALAAPVGYSWFMVTAGGVVKILVCILLIGVGALILRFRYKRLHGC
ncbi:MAG: PQQ-binding-like beta-propeller repeat protein [Candidatus Brocadiia bacterium]